MGGAAADAFSIFLNHAASPGAAPLLTSRTRMAGEAVTPADLSPARLRGGGGHLLSGRGAAAAPPRLAQRRATASPPGAAAADDDDDEARTAAAAEILRRHTNGYAESGEEEEEEQQQLHLSSSSLRFGRHAEQGGLLQTPGEDTERSQKSSVLEAVAPLRALEQRLRAAARSAGVAGGAGAEEEEEGDDLAFDDDGASERGAPPPLFSKASGSFGGALFGTPSAGAKLLLHTEDADASASPSLAALRSSDSGLLGGSTFSERAAAAVEGPMRAVRRLLYPDGDPADPQSAPASGDDLASDPVAAMVAAAAAACGLLGPTGQLADEEEQRLFFGAGGAPPLLGAEDFAAAFGGGSTEEALLRASGASACAGGKRAAAAVASRRALAAFLSSLLAPSPSPAAASSQHHHQQQPRSSSAAGDSGAPSAFASVAASRRTTAEGLDAASVTTAGDDAIRAVALLVRGLFFLWPAAGICCIRLFGRALARWPPAHERALTSFPSPLQNRSFLRGGGSSAAHDCGASFASPAAEGSAGAGRSPAASFCGGSRSSPRACSGGGAPPRPSPRQLLRALLEREASAAPCGGATPSAAAAPSSSGAGGERREAAEAEPPQFWEARPLAYPSDYWQDKRVVRAAAAAPCPASHSCFRRTMASC